MNRDPHTSFGMVTASGNTRLRVGVLGLNAWLVVCLIPSLHAGVGSVATFALSFLPLALLAAGLGALDRRDSLARWVLLGAFPPGLGAWPATRSELRSQDTYDETTMLLAAASMVAYFAAAAHATSRARSTTHATVHPLTGKNPVVEPPPRRWLRRALLAGATIGSVAIAVLAPALGSRRERVEAWNDAADDGAVLTAVVASIVCALALGGVVGPALRAERRQPSGASASRRRLVVALSIAVVAAVAWLLLRNLDRA